MFNLFLEDGDLLEMTELNELIVQEGSLLINRSKLNDEKYVKDLIADLKKNPSKLTLGDILATFAAGGAYGLLGGNPAFAPLIGAMLSIYLQGGIDEDSIRSKSKEKILKGLDKLIERTEKDLNKVKSDSDKKKLEAELKKLKNNRKMIEEKVKTKK